MQSRQHVLLPAMMRRARMGFTQQYNSRALESFENLPPRQGFAAGGFEPLCNVVIAAVSGLAGLGQAEMGQQQAG